MIRNMLNHEIITGDLIDFAPIQQARVLDIDEENATLLLEYIFREQPYRTRVDIPKGTHEECRGFSYYIATDEVACVS